MLGWLFEIEGASQSEVPNGMWAGDQSGRRCYSVKLGIHINQDAGQTCCYWHPSWGVFGLGRWRFPSPQGKFGPRQGPASQVELLNQGGQKVDTSVSRGLGKKELAKKLAEETEALKDPSRYGIKTTWNQFKVACRCFRHLWVHVRQAFQL